MPAINRAILLLSLPTKEDQSHVASGLQVGAWMEKQSPHPHKTPLTIDN